MSNYGADTNTERMYEYLDDARAAEREAREYWAEENGYDPEDEADHIEAEWREHKAFLQWQGNLD